MKESARPDVSRHASAPNGKRFEFPFTSDAGFQRAMGEDEICRRVISAFTGLNVQSIESSHSEYALTPVLGARGVRLDVLVRADGRLVNIEMQRANRGDLARRMRHYQATADTHSTEKGSSVRNLAEHVIVFACTFDPVGYDAPRYNYRMRSSKDPEGRFDPGMTWILLNATAWNHEDDPELARLLRYMDQGDVAGDLCTMIDDVLERAHGNRLWKEGARQMMTIEQRIEWAESVGEERGLQKGIAEGATLEREELNRLNKHLVDAGRMDDLARSLSDPDFQQQLLDELKTSGA